MEQLGQDEGDHESQGDERQADQPAARLFGLLQGPHLFRDRSPQDRRVNPTWGRAIGPDLAEAARKGQTSANYRGGFIQDRSDRHRLAPIVRIYSLRLSSIIRLFAKRENVVTRSIQSLNEL